MTTQFVLLDDGDDDDVSRRYCEDSGSCGDVVWRGSSVIVDVGDDSSDSRVKGLRVDVDVVGVGGVGMGG